MSNRGPLGSLSNSPLIDEGTLVRTASGAPGAIGATPRERAKQIANLLRASKGFSDCAIDHMRYLASPAHAKNMVGSRSGISKKPKFVTNCITFVVRVLAEAFVKTSKPVTAKKVTRLRAKGTDLAAYLVKIGWTAAFCNPDINHPADGDDEHIAAYRTAKKHKKYYEIPIKYLITNYNPTPKSHPQYENHWGMSKSETKKDTTNLKILKKVKFAYGLSRGGKHTWLFSYGRVYEVHWEEVGSALYDSSPFEDYPWLSSLIVFPPDAAAERLQDLFATP